MRNGSDKNHQSPICFFAISVATSERMLFRISPAVGAIFVYIRLNRLTASSVLGESTVKSVNVDFRTILSSLVRSSSSSVNSLAAARAVAVHGKATPHFVQYFGTK